MPKRLAIDEIFDQSIRNSPFYEPLLDQTFAKDTKGDDEDLADLLKRMDVVQGKPDDGIVNNEQSLEDEIHEAETQAMGNSLVLSTVGWSLDDGQSSMPGDVEEEDTPVSSKFSTLVARHRKQLDGSRALNPAEVWQRFESSLIGGEEEVKTDIDTNNTPEDDESVSV